MNEAPAARPTVTKSPLRVLSLPGWLDSGPGHWQTLWESQHGDTRVVQSDWLWPKRGDWMARLEEVLLEDERPALLAAHSLGCQLVAAWAALAVVAGWVGVSAVERVISAPRFP